jgi:hypothetical protein
MFISRYLISILFIASLASCGGGSGSSNNEGLVSSDNKVSNTSNNEESYSSNNDDSDSSNNESADGIWSGYTTNNYGETSETTAFFYDGDFVAVNYEFDEFYSGSYSINGDNISSSDVNAYDWNGPLIGKGSLDGIFSQQNSIFASIRGDSDATALVQFMYEASISEASITYADLTGTWLGTDDSVGLAYAIAIDEQGFVAAQATDGCSVAGSVNIPQNNLNIFEVQLIITGNDCSVNGTYSGLGLLYEGEISMAYSNDNYGFAFDAVKLGQ